MRGAHGLGPTPTFGYEAIARLSGSVSETWLWPVRSNSSSIPSWRVLRSFNAAIFSVRFFAGRPLAPSSAASVRSRRLRWLGQALVRRADHLHQLLTGEVAVRAIDRFQPGPVDGKQFASEQVHFAARSTN